MSDLSGQRVLVIGASVAGLAVAEGLRRAGHTGPLRLVDQEPRALYDRPPLSKQYLAGEWEHDRLALRTTEALSALDMQWVLGDCARQLDVGRRAVQLESGTLLEADAIVIATGVRARRLTPASDRVHTLRDLEDARRLRKNIRRGIRLAVVGNGVLGSEIAATAASLGVEVTLTGSDEQPMRRVLGPLGAEVLAGHHLDAGVRLLGRRRARAVHAGTGRDQVVELDDGTVLTADEVVVAIGSVANTEWLESSDLRLHDGVVCDAWSRAAAGVWAVGDVARFEHLVHGVPVRLDNRTNAVEQGLAVAKDILGVGAAYVPVPYFWSDQYGTRIQVYGEIGPGDEVEVVEGSRDAGRFTAVSRRDGGVTGVLGWGMPKQARLHALDLFAQAQHIRDSAVYPTDHHEETRS